MEDLRFSSQMIRFGFASIDPHLQSSHSEISEVYPDKLGCYLLGFKSLARELEEAERDCANVDVAGYPTSAGERNISLAGIGMQATAITVTQVI